MIYQLHGSEAMNHWDLDPNYLAGAWKHLVALFRRSRRTRLQHVHACLLGLLG